MFAWSTLRLPVVIILVLGLIALLTHDIVYYNGFGHVAGGIVMWLAVFVSHILLCSTSGILRPEALCACLAPVFFYFGREMRDLQKLGYMDWYGLLMPVGASVLLTTAYLVWVVVAADSTRARNQYVPFVDVDRQGKN
tara:strand:- start:461 stop:874 length:414 start_codon:yes stop_codon:yes gene_type:complete